MTQMPFVPKRALLSVSDKRGLPELAAILQKQNIEMVATGNTAALLRQHQFSVTEVSECTHWPEMLDGRVKTLHPAIHAGLLARQQAEDEKTLESHQLKRFDLLIINLYPFEQVIKKSECDFNQALEHIDIGGPAMIRSAAKNHANVFVIVSPDDYSLLGQYLEKKQAPEGWNFALARKAFAHTAGYDGAIANYFGSLNESKLPSGFPATLSCQFNKQYELRYGENPHQQAIFYRDKYPQPGSLATAQLLQGKALSYNNLLDADAALNCIKSFPEQAFVCAIIKHGNPCGIALDNSALKAYLRAFAADPTSAFGGIIAFNQDLDAKTAETILEKQFAEVIIAPTISPAAQAILQSKPNIRVLSTGQWQTHSECKLDMRRIDGGLLVQEFDDLPLDFSDFKVVTKAKPTQDQLQDLHFAWAAVKSVKSNAIVFAKELATIGIGGGQTSRIMSTQIGLWQAHQAQFSTQGAVMASDAFIPFPDNIHLAGQAGIAAIIQPGGSVRDAEVITAANEAKIAMVFTGIRHFRH